MGKSSLFFSGFICFTVATTSLLSLPKDPSVVSGDVKVQISKPNQMVIEASNRAIIDYKSFDIQAQEKVQFIQPSSSSVILNRVRGDKASQILGQIEGNGKVLLVNPNGMYFGPNASVKVASLIASTLDISNDNFLKDEYSFHLNNKDHGSLIRNDGLLSAAPEGSIVLMAPKIQNFGTISAQVGKVVLAAGEHITLDFHGDGLLNFSVEGDIKGAILENLGSIQAEGGSVFMKMPTAKKAIRDIVNHAGIEKGEVFVKQNGEVHLVPASSIQAKQVELEASALSIAGMIDVSDKIGAGGDVRLLGAEIQMKGSSINASGASGGGNVWIGGEYQGQGSMAHAEVVSMDKASQILVDATEKGQGGQAILWSQKETRFEGEISARGGVQGGDGGFIETSSVADLIALGKVDTRADKGKIGQWLLDPSTLYIVAGASANPGCGGGMVGTDTIEASASTVILCSNEIYLQDSITMTVEESGLIFKAPSGETGDLFLDGGDITTLRGDVLVRNLDTNIRESTSIDTTGGGVYPTGGAIVFEKVNASDYTKFFAIEAGIATVEMGEAGLVSPLGDLTVSAEEFIAKSIITRSRPITVAAKTVLSSDATFDTSLGGGAAILLETVNGILPGTQSLVVDAGTAAFAAAGIGITTPLQSFTLARAADGVHTGDIFTIYGDITIVPSIELEQSHTVYKTFAGVNVLESGGISLNNITASIHREQSLTLLSGQKGAVSLGNIGSSSSVIKAIQIETNQPFSVNTVYSEAFLLLGGSGNASLNGNMIVDGTAGVTVLASDILLGGGITTENLDMKARNSILNQDGDTPTITVPSTGSVRLVSSKLGTVGEEDSPIYLDFPGVVTAGGGDVYISGNYSSIDYIEGLRPCLVTFRGVSLPCRIGAFLNFYTLPKQVTTRTFFLNPILLGLAFPPTVSNGFQLSWDAPIRATSGNLCLDCFSAGPSTETESEKSFGKPPLAEPVAM